MLLVNARVDYIVLFVSLLTYFVTLCRTPNLSEHVFF